MTLTPEQKAKGWIEWNGGPCPIKDVRTRVDVMLRRGAMYLCEPSAAWSWGHVFGSSDIIAYRITVAYGADAERWMCVECGGSVPSMCNGISCSRPTPFPRDYSELVWDADGWSQTIIVDGKRPEWLRDDDGIAAVKRKDDRSGHWNDALWEQELAIRVRRREPKRETVQCSIFLDAPVPKVRAYIDLIDGKADLSTLKIAEDAL